MFQWNQRGIAPMQISDILDSSTYAASSTQQESKTASSFASCFLDAQDSTSASSSTSSSASTSSMSSGDKALQEFMRYAKETPAERMFDSWLSSQNISEKQYNAMTPAQQQALHQKFEQQLEQKLKDESLATLNSAVTSSSVSV